MYVTPEPRTSRCVRLRQRNSIIGGEDWARLTFGDGTCNFRRVVLLEARPSERLGHPSILGICLEPVIATPDFDLTYPIAAKVER